MQAILLSVTLDSIQTTTVKDILFCDMILNIILFTNLYIFNNKAKAVSLNTHFFYLKMEPYL